MLALRCLLYLNCCISHVRTAHVDLQKLKRSIEMGPNREDQVFAIATWRLVCAESFPVGVIENACVAGSVPLQASTFKQCASRANPFLLG
jgi:hypothetical protein